MAVETLPTRPNEHEGAEEIHQVMTFAFLVGEHRYGEVFTVQDFSKKDIDVKLLNGIGQASAFRQSEEHYYLPFLRNIANKGVGPKKQLTEPQVKQHLKRLSKEGFAANGGPRYRLTTAGYERLIEDNGPKNKTPAKKGPSTDKSRAGAQSGAKNEAITAGTSLRIVELIMRDTCAYIELDTVPEDIPEYTEWWKPRNNDTSIFPLLSNLLDISIETANSRVLGLRAKDYVEVEVSQGGETNNIRGTKAGLEYAQRQQRGLREREKVLDETEVEHAQELVEGCINLATSLGDMELVEDLKKKYHEKSLFELPATEFAKTSKKLERLFKKLQGRFVAKPIIRQAA